jgi:hypothetical protein
MRKARKVSSILFLKRSCSSAFFLADFDLMGAFNAFVAAFFVRREVDRDADAFLRAEV